MGHALYYCSTVSAVTMATCCSITVIILPLYCQPISISYGIVIMSHIFQRLSSLLYCCKLIITSLSRNYAMQQSLNTPTSLLH
jgi:hypothetical protein